jgi:hypothetical protein
LSLAYAVRAAIAKRGTKAQFFMRRALTEMGLNAVVEYDATGAHYNVDVAVYLQNKLDALMKRSGMMK